MSAGVPASARYLYPRYTAFVANWTLYRRFYNHDRVHHGRLAHGRMPAAIVYGARRMQAR